MTASNYFMLVNLWNVNPVLLERSSFVNMSIEVYCQNKLIWSTGRLGWEQINQQTPNYWGSVWQNAFNIVFVKLCFVNEDPIIMPSFVALITIADQRRPSKPRAFLGYKYYLRQRWDGSRNKHGYDWMSEYTPQKSMGMTGWVNTPHRKAWE